MSREHAREHPLIFERDASDYSRSYSYLWLPLRCSEFDDSWLSAAMALQSRFCGHICSRREIARFQHYVCDEDLNFLLVLSLKQTVVSCHCVAHDVWRSADGLSASNSCITLSVCGDPVCARIPSLLRKHQMFACK